MDYWQDFEPEGYYHIYNKSGTGIKLFKDDNDHKVFLERFERYLGGALNTYAYVLMSNHFHFLVKVKSINELLSFAKTQKTNKSNDFMSTEIDPNEFIIDQFKRFLSSYTITYKNKYKHSGSVLMKRFKRIQSMSMEKNRYWLAYIHHNPIHHKYRKEYTEWTYCSYNAYLLTKETKTLKDEVLNQWFSSLEDFLQYHAAFKMDKQWDFDQQPE